MHGKKLYINGWCVVYKEADVGTTPWNCEIYVLYSLQVCVKKTLCSLQLFRYHRRYISGKYRIWKKSVLFSHQNGKLQDCLALNHTGLKQRLSGSKMLYYVLAIKKYGTVIMVSKI